MTDYQKRARALKEKIVDKTFTVLPSGNTLVCELVLESGYVVTGKYSHYKGVSVNDPVDTQLAEKKATDELWLLEDYHVMQKVYDEAWQK